MTDNIDPNVILILLIFCGLILLWVVGSELYYKYHYLLHWSKEERKLSKETSDKYDDFIDGKITKKEFAKWIYDKQVENQQIRRKKKLDKLSKLNGDS